LFFVFPSTVVNQKWISKGLIKSDPLYLYLSPTPNICLLAPTPPLSFDHCRPQTQAISDVNSFYHEHKDDLFILVCSSGKFMMRRQEQAAARQEKLKQAYLQKQLEKLKASSKVE
jgi:hypothetical protein